MKHVLIAFLIAVLGIGFGAPEAEAKRLGGGGSFGMQRQITPPPRQPSPPAQQVSPQQQARQPAAPGAQPQRRSWMGPIAGLAAGLGLAALFSHLGLGEELASVVMIALLAMAALFLFRLLFRRRVEAPSGGLGYAGGATPGSLSPASSPTMQRQSVTPMSPAAGAGAAQGAFPVDFDAEAFARQAKVQFIRLQAANDAGNLEDIREFTTPEVFAEIRMQLAERGPGPQRTDVVELHAEVLEVVEEASRYVVSIRFHGLLREDADAAPTPFDEVWHLVKPVNGGSGWVVAGIQQLA